MPMQFLPGRLEEIRVLAGLSRADLSAKSKVTAEAIRLIESGQSAPRPITVRKLAKALGVTSSDLYSNDGVGAA